MAGIKVALLGYGTVGEGVYQAVQSHQKKLCEILGGKVEIAGVLIKDKTKDRQLPESIVVSDNMEDILSIPDLKVVIDAIAGIEPGFTYLKKAIEQGIHVISANKELMAHKGTVLCRLAKEKGVRLEYEAAVAGAIPVIGTLRHLLHVNNITKIEAILNGTSNFILTNMKENGLEFEQALQLAQEKGYAEADPGNDVDGWDAFYKLMIISDLLLGSQPTWETVNCQGIRNIQRSDLQYAAEAGFTLKLIASLTINDGNCYAAVDVMALSSSHPLYDVEGVDNAVVMEGDLAGTIKLQGPGAGAKPTASAMIQDLALTSQSEPGRSIRSDVAFTKGDLEIRDWLVIGNTNFLNRVDSSKVSVYPTSSEMVWKVSIQEELYKELIGDNPDLRSFPLAKENQKESSKIPAVF